MKQNENNTITLGICGYDFLHYTKRKEQNQMKNSFYYYHRQNELILRLMLLPFTLCLWAIKKLCSAIAKRHTYQKH